jgi:hypothetical protein
VPQLRPPAQLERDGIARGDLIRKWNADLRLKNSALPVERKESRRWADVSRHRADRLRRQCHGIARGAAVAAVDCRRRVGSNVEVSERPRESWPRRSERGDGQSFRSNDARADQAKYLRLRPTNRDRPGQRIAHTRQLRSR